MRKTGFTLIELLVVIAIIAILAAILFPVFLVAKQAAGKSSCLSNCKQIATGLSMYKDDNQQSWMSCYWQGDPTKPGYDPVYKHAFWMRVLMPYVRNKRVYQCPAAPTREDSNWKRCDQTYGGAEPMTSWLASNYGINECLVESIWATQAGLTTLNKECVIRYPTRTALIAECNYVVFWGGDPTSIHSTTVVGGVSYPDGMLRIKYPNCPNASGATPVYTDRTTRHGGFTNVVFADLHVKSIATNDIRITGTNTSNVHMNPVIWPFAQPM